MQAGDSSQFVRNGPQAPAHACARPNAGLDLCRPAALTSGGQKAEATRATIRLEQEQGARLAELGEIDRYMPRTKRQIDKPDQRILHQDVIPPPGGKVFSVFEKHSLWNRKGKVALGHCASRIR